MKKVTIKGTYETVFGSVIQIDPVDGLNIGDVVMGSDEYVYKIKKIIMPTTPKCETIGLVVGCGPYGRCKDH